MRGESLEERPRPFDPVESMAQSHRPERREDFEV
jgi:hypothetical protein